MAGYDKCERFDSNAGKLLSAWKPVGLGTFTPDGRFLICIDGGRSTKTVKVGGNAVTYRQWVGRAVNCHDAVTGQLIWRFPLPDETSILTSYGSAILAVTDSQILVLSQKISRGQEGKQTVKRLALRTGKVLETFTPLEEIGENWTHSWTLKVDGTIAFQLDDSLASQSKLDLSGRAYRRTFQLPADGQYERYFFPLRFNRTEQFLAGVRSSGRNSYAWNSDIGRLCLWNRKGKLLWTAKPDTFSANALQFSPDSRFVAMGGHNWHEGANPLDDSVYVYEVATGRLVKELTQSTWVNKTSIPINRLTRQPKAVHLGAVSSLAWSPDSRRLAVTYQRVVRVWKVK